MDGIILGDNCICVVIPDKFVMTVFLIYCTDGFVNALFCPTDAFVFTICFITVIFVTKAP